MSELYIVGKRISADGKQWEFQGVFGSRDLAIDACHDCRFFIGPATLNKEIPLDTSPWPGAWFPKHGSEEFSFAKGNLEKGWDEGLEVDYRAAAVRDVRVSVNPPVALEVFRGLARNQRRQMFEQQLYEQACAHLAVLLKS